MLIAPRFDAVHPFQGDRARVQIAGRYGIIDLAGHEDVPVTHDAVRMYGHGYVQANIAGITTLFAPDGHIMTQGTATYIVPLDQTHVLLGTSQYTSGM